MNRTALSCCLIVFAAYMTSYSVANSQEPLLAGNRSDYVSDASQTIATYVPESFENSPEIAATAAKRFLNTFDDDQKSRVKHPIDSPERRLWTNLPARANAGGIRLGDCSQKQIEAFCDLMATLFSKHGYEKMRNIMLADDQLLTNGQARTGFGTENFSVVIFGEPSTTDPWAFQLDGHHVGVNVSLTGEKLTMSPSFIGTQPQTFEISGKKFRPLTGEIDDAYRLVNSLSDDQRKQAVIRDRRDKIATGPGFDNQVPKPQGLSCKTMNDEQQEILLTLIDQWVSDLPVAHAKQRMEQIKKELGETTFAWNGAIRKSSDISYIIQGPSLIIEYACQDLGGNPQQHLHTMYRNPQNEYGLQIGSATQ